MMRRARFFTSAFCLVPFALAGSACGPKASQPTTVRLAIEGRDNATPAVAARDRLVVVTWSAAIPEGGTDIFAAVSDDAGMSFRAPVRVNDRTGEARANGEQPPRVAIGPALSGVEGEIGVLWTTRRDGKTEVRLSRSADNGRTFGPSVAVHPEGLTGARGWMSLAIDDAGAIHVAWLDGRNATPKPAAAPAPASGSGHQHHASGGGDSRQDLYYSVFRPDGTHTESQVATYVCFCCKTAVVTDASGRASIAWRHIFPNDLRDIAYRTLDESQSVGDAVRISEDQWQLKGCPDDGPAMVRESSGRVHLVWPTMVAGEKPAKGIFYASTEDGRTFSPRVRLDAGSAPASHPQLVLTGSGELVALWDEPRENTRQVLLRRRAADGQWRPVETLDAETAAYYPAAAAVPDALIVTWASATTPRSTIGVERRPIAR